MAVTRPTKALAVSLLCAALILPASIHAQSEQEWHIGMSSVGDLKYKAGFAHFDYVNPEAPKGGDLKLSETGTFDTLNPVLAKGSAAVGLPMVFDTLMKASLDEITAEYGLLAEAVSYPDDVSSVTFRLRAEAKWADGTAVTPADVVFSFEKSKEHNPQLSLYYNHVISAEVSGERDVTFRFDEKNNRELPNIVGQLQIVPKHWWEANGPDGKPRDISRTTMEPVMGSGPYRIAAVSPGSTIRYERREDYWGKALNVNVGQNNFGSVSYTFYGDRDVEFEAFRAGNTDYWQENQASRWATGFDFPAVKDGRVKLEDLPNPYRAVGIMQAMVPNMRRDLFKDQRVREALNYAYDFEELNRTVFYNQYKRIDSYFYGTELASSGLPDGHELEILESLRDKVPPEVFTRDYRNPIGGDPQKERDNLRKAIGLLKEAGYELKGNRMVNAKTGAPFTFEILLNSPDLERIAVPYAKKLRKIGIEMSVRTVDASQYVNRMRSFDYDMTTVVWAQSLDPGNEQAFHWGSKSATQEGSRNYAGISDPGVDALVGKVIFAKDRTDLIAAVKALDRVLLAHHYVIPQYTRGTMPIAYWDRFGRKADLPYYSIGFPDVWWSKSAQ